MLLEEELSIVSKDASVIYPIELTFFGRYDNIYNLRENPDDVVYDRKQLLSEISQEGSTTPVNVR